MQHSNSAICSDWHRLIRSITLTFERSKRSFCDMDSSFSAALTTIKWNPLISLHSTTTLLSHSVTGMARKTKEMRAEFSVTFNKLSKKHYIYFFRFQKLLAIGIEAHIMISENLMPWCNKYTNHYINLQIHKITILIYVLKEQHIHKFTLKRIIIILKLPAFSMYSLKISVHFEVLIFSQIPIFSSLDIRERKIGWASEI